MKTFIITLSMLLALVSCSNSESDKGQVSNATEDQLVDSNQFPDGEFVQKYPSGTIQIKGDMLNNKRDGLWTAYYENGAKQSESTYESGFLHGRTASFYTNGQVRYIGYFFGGNKDGKWDFYTEDGELEKTEMYVKGELSTE